MILWAVNENKIDEVREVLRINPEAVNAVDNDGYTPLHRYGLGGYSENN